jgi:hypothetical protein
MVEGLQPRLDCEATATKTQPHTARMRCGALVILHAIRLWGRGLKLLLQE